VQSEKVTLQRFSQIGFEGAAEPVAAAESRFRGRDGSAPLEAAFAPNCALKGKLAEKHGENRRKSGGE
jgi:hypothetical protein